MLVSRRTHISESSQEHPGASWGRLGASFGRLGGALGHLGGDLGASWGRVGLPWGSETRIHQEIIFLRLLGAPRSILGPLGGVLAHLVGVSEAP